MPHLGVLVGCLRILAHTVAGKVFNAGKVGQCDKVGECFDEEKDQPHQSQVTENVTRASVDILFARLRGQPK
jgi:hypothetical protein